MTKEFKYYISADNYISFISKTELIMDIITNFTKILEVKDDDLKDLIITLVWVQNDTKTRSIYYSLVSPNPNQIPEGRWLEYFKNSINEYYS